eukprot:15480660-Alexandrium_andersonii.AAC.1
MAIGNKCVAVDGDGKQVCGRTTPFCQHLPKWVATDGPQRFLQYSVPSRVAAAPRTLSHRKCPKRIRRALGAGNSGGSGGIGSDLATLLTDCSLRAA